MKKAIPLACLLLSCIPRQGPVKSRIPLSVAVATVYDSADSNAVGSIPAAEGRRINEVLTQRNLKPMDLAPEVMAIAFAARRTTPQRMALLAENQDVDMFLLVEETTRFYSEMNGRFRWEVEARVTLARKGALEQASSSSISIPAYVDYDNQREPEALAVAGARIAQEVGRVTDQFLGGLGGAQTSRAHPGWVADADEAEAVRLAAPKKEPADDSIYFVLVDRFAKGGHGTLDPSDPQGFHGGNLQGVLEHVDDLASLGVKTVWLSPVFKMRTEKFHGYGAYHGYWVEDFDAIEPRFGTTADLAALSDALHKRGMRLLLDIVLNHVAPEGSLTKSHPDWFHHNGPITDWNDPVQLTTRDIYGLPDLAQENPAVYDYLLKESLAWIDRVHPDGFRLDAARHIGIDFWKKYTGDIHAHAGRDFQLLGEMFDGNPSTLSKTKLAAGFDGVFDFPLYYAAKDVFCDDAPLSRLAVTLFADRQYDDPSKLITFLDNHDLSRILSACHGDEKRVEQALTFMLTARGTPSITYGTEAGLTGDKEPANRADMRFESKGPLQEQIRKLLAQRAAHPSLQADAVSTLDELSKNGFRYKRKAGGEVADIFVNYENPKGGVRIGFYKDRGSELAEALPCPVVFRAPTIPAPGETLEVVGSGPELGDWDPAHGVPVSKQGDQWSAQVTLPSRGAFEWKFARKGPDGPFHFEDGPNHALFVRPTRGDVQSAPLQW